MKKIIDYVKNVTAENPDYSFKKIQVDKQTIFILFNEVLISTVDTNMLILKSLVNLDRKKLKVLDKSLAHCNIKVIKKDEIFKYVNEGFFVILYNKIYAVEQRAYLDRGVATAEKEISLKGPRDAFVENYNTNLGLIRRRIKTTDLMVHNEEIGRYTKTRIGILYIKGLTDLDLVEQVKLKLSTIDIDGIIDSTYLMENLESKNNSFFPTIVSTERPDKVCMGLLEGKVCIVVDNSPFVLIMPNFFIDFFHTVDDYYQKPVNITFIRIIRILAFFVSIFTPALYIMIATHNHDLVSLSFLLSLKAQRESVPVPAILEMILMMISFEILRESDIRMSSTSGSSVSILGGLILGDAAVSAGIVSPIMIIIVAISSVSGLLFNSIEMVSAIRWWRFIMVILAAFFGIFGIILGFLILFIRLITIKSFGRHYLYPFVPFKRKMLKDTIFKEQNKGEKLRNPMLTHNMKRGHFR